MSNLTDFFSAGSSNNVLEVVSGVSDGRTVTVNSTNYNFANVSTYTSVSTSFANLAGGYIDYVPPSGTKYVSFKCYFKYKSIDYSGILGYRLYWGGQNVPYANRHMAGNYSNGGNNHPQFLGMCMFVFDLTVSTSNIPQGKIAPGDWTTATTIKVMVRDYASSYDCYVNINNWEDGAGASGVEQIDRPTIEVIAYG